jgi:hypothetical protein
MLLKQSWISVSYAFVFHLIHNLWRWNDAILYTFHILASSVGFCQFLSVDKIITILEPSRFKSESVPAFNAKYCSAKKPKYQMLLVPPSHVQHIFL